MEKIGRYELVDELGSGAMGVVYQAVDPNIGRTVALKTMRLDGGFEHDEMLFRFRNEARAAGLMNHPNIVTIHDADECDGLFYIAMEYIEGETLHSVIARKRQIPAEWIVGIAKQVANGLEYAHAMRIVHRDIKPENIMITKQSVAKIMDFGISKTVDTKTRTGQVLGTPHYMSPEQVTGGSLDGRSDLFSFGIVLYEMATGERPFVGVNVATIIYKIVHENPLPPCEVQMAVHPGLSAVIARCLAKNPDDRYQTGAQLAADLEEFRYVKPADERPTSVLPLSVKDARPQSGRQQVSNQPSGQPSGPHVIATRRAPVASQSVAIEPTCMKQPTAPVQRRSTKRKSIVLAAALFVLISSVILRFAQQHTRRTQSLSAMPTQGGQSASPAPPPSSAQAAVTASLSVQTHGSAAARSLTAQPAPEKGQPSSRTSRVAIHFSSNPEGALVQFDGRSRPAWLTPFTIADIVPGKHEAVFTKDGYSMENRQLEIGSKDSPYHIDLVPETTAVAISSDPPGARVEIDGADTGRVTPVQITVAEGQHTIVLRLAGYRPAQAKPQIDKGQIYDLPQQLTPVASRTSDNAITTAVQTANALVRSLPEGMGLIDFITNPPGADIYIEGRQANRATPAHNVFPPGDYSIELRLPGYRPLQRTVHVDAGRISKVDEVLAPQ